MKRLAIAMPLLLASLVATHAAFNIFMAQTSNVCWAVGADGWTNICATPITTGTCAAGTADGTCIYYVSSSLGNNTANNCLTIGSPCATVVYAQGKMRNGKPDWLLAKMGDTFASGDVPDLINPLSGASSTAPMLFSSYDPAFPGVPDPAGSSLAPPIFQATPASNQSCFGAGAGGDYIAIIGINCYNYTRDPGNAAFNTAGIADVQGLRWTTPVHWVLVEDSTFSFFQQNLFDGDIGGANTPQSNVMLRRSRIVNSYTAGTGHSSGFHAALVTTGLLIEENIFDHNGWNTCCSPNSDPTTFNHNVYLDGSNGPAVFRRNITTRASLTGAQVRPGGTVYGNLATDNAIGMWTARTPSTYTYNVITEGKDLVPGTPEGVGSLVLSSIGSVYQNNIVANVTGTAQGALQIDTSDDPVSFDIANPTTVTLVEQDTYFLNGNLAKFTTTGALPAAISSGCSSGCYFRNVAPYPATANLSTTPSGALIDTTGNTQSGTQRVHIQAVNTIATNNIFFNWGATAQIQDNGINSTITPNVICPDATPANCTPAQTYSAPTRSVGGYNATISGCASLPAGCTATLAAFITNAAGTATVPRQTKQNWRSDLTAIAVINYIRAGFDLAPIN